jgi:hypothetical protein
MNARIVLFGVCLLGALGAVACGSEDDSGTSNGGASGSSGKGSGGKGSGGKGSGGESGAAEAGMSGEGGAAGAVGGGCTHLSAFVHGVIKNDSNERAAPTPVNGVVFCDDPADATAYSDLF